MLTPTADGVRVFIGIPFAEPPWGSLSTPGISPCFVAISQIPVTEIREGTFGATTWSLPTSNDIGARPLPVTSWPAGPRSDFGILSDA